MLLNRLTFHSPKTLDEAIDLYAGLQGVRILAGGTFLMNALKLFKRKGIKSPEHILSLKKISDLKGIYYKDGLLTIKSMTTISELFESPYLKDNFKLLRTVCRNISTNPIRNMATVGGNLTCRYTWTELGSAMIALDAKMHFLGKDKKEEILNVEEFFKASAKTDKIFTHLTIKHDPTFRYKYVRIKKMSDVDVPKFAVCLKGHLVNGKMNNLRLIVNNGNAFAQHDTTLEDFLNKRELNEQTAQEALNYLNTSIYDLKSDEYKQHLFRVSIKNLISELAGELP